MENIINLEKFAEGALAEKVNIALKEVLSNIADPNTDWKTKRKLTIDITFESQEDRQLALLDIKTKKKLAEPKSIGTRIIIDTDGKGGILASEYKKQIPGQSTMRVDEETGEIVTTAEEKTNDPIDLNGIKLVK
ncbi:replication terminator protein [Clostridium botulinum]|uniref:replication terminator protein n=1 Tax=unclassified Clostridium TaxID=2614128 RepID=UPI0013C76D58|nr:MULTISPECIES: replication terminator protein [unclassified Clostridium]NFN78666.1 replication terminator protein [Clostridium botulinum]NFO78860.1 replication terminator protein [Clostridium botulinum]NFP05742.1 replication terminator protein [Clostridium botulinum]NFS02257.1 replication terminator protein [Clostridium botulinum]NFT97346.1 replication terminator protein [Clostridium botulinum]